MKKLLLILICLFVSFEVKSKYIVLECEIKKTIYTIKNEEGKFIKNILDTSFNMMTLYLDEKNQWLNSYMIDEEYLEVMKLDENQNMIIEDKVKETVTKQSLKMASRELDKCQDQTIIEEKLPEEKKEE